VTCSTCPRQRESLAVLDYRWHLNNEHMKVLRNCPVALLGSHPTNTSIMIGAGRRQDHLRRGFFLACSCNSKWCLRCSAGLAAGLLLASRWALSPCESSYDAFAEVLVLQSIKSHTFTRQGCTMARGATSNLCMSSTWTMIAKTNLSAVSFKPGQVHLSFLLQKSVLRLLCCHTDSVCWGIVHENTRTES
jgi:hypothetical protein